MTATGAGPLCTRQRGPALVAKRTIDVLVAASLLVLCAPVLFLAAIAVRATSPGPALYRGTRVGRFGERFTVYKLRSMVADADPAIHAAYVHELSCGRGVESDGLYKLHDDPRITPVGRWLRRTSLDELPQLVNVLKGDMSLVGPRPECEYDLADYESWHWRRFSVLPGMTGLWQVSGRGCLPPPEMLRLDVEYADTWSLRQDLSILLRTVPAVLTERGSR
ncbi:MAG TPA: sugar transferase [Acidimicrobiales bacterium]|nr:sugar transferase [Acidimicrobiales bacterium]